MVIYFNPSCSRARGAREILEARDDVDLEVIEYLKRPPTREELERILDAIPDPPAELVRKDKRFEELGLSADDYATREQVVELLLAHPELMQRPVVFRGAQARICRPSEKVLELFDA
jgi:arsenate reductase